MTIWVPPYTSDPEIYATFTEQQEQGNEFMFGWWAKGWAEIQQAYFVSLSRCNTGKRWLSQLIRKQWEVSWDLWRHRMEVAATSDSFSVARAHARLNIEIHILYNVLSTTTYPPLQRWFRQPVAIVCQQSLSFKQDWLSMVRSFSDPADTIM